LLRSFENLPVVKRAASRHFAFDDNGDDSDDGRHGDDGSHDGDNGDDGIQCGDDSGTPTN
jgi:hypothetical protein